MAATTRLFEEITRELSVFRKLRIAPKQKTRKLLLCGNEENMSEHPSFDRKKGFVALPVEVLELDLTPGAFRLLVELCRMANLDGYCWPSLGQLSERLGRSRSAISGYIKDLRKEALIETEEQKTATGYNYRLKYRVTFWQQWRSDIAAPRRPKTERSVQQNERISKDKNQSHKNQTLGKTESDYECLVSKWAGCFKGAPYPNTSKQPTEELLRKTHLALKDTPDKTPIISADIISGLTDFWKDLGIDVSSGGYDLQAKRIHELGLQEQELPTVLASIKQRWPHHWRREPSQEQFDKLLRQANVSPRKAQRNVLKGYLKRWELAQRHLPRDAQSGFVPINKPSAFAVAAE